LHKTAVDGVVRARDIRRPVAGQEEHKIGDLRRRREADVASQAVSQMVTGIRMSIRSAAGETSVPGPLASVRSTWATWSHTRAVMTGRPGRGQP
jgi:hypothetical protein